MKGLGDLVAVITKYTGIRWVVDKVFTALGKDCGCTARQKRWNKLLPFASSNSEEDTIINKLLSSEETCVVCSSPVDIDVDLQVDQRAYYVQGAGQVCEKCYHNIMLP